MHIHEIEESIFGVRARDADRVRLVCRDQQLPANPTEFQCQVNGDTRRLHFSLWPVSPDKLLTE